MNDVQLRFKDMENEKKAISKCKAICDDNYKEYHCKAILITKYKRDEEDVFGAETGIHAENEFFKCETSQLGKQLCPRIGDENILTQQFFKQGELVKSTDPE